MRSEFNAGQGGFKAQTKASELPDTVPVIHKIFANSRQLVPNTYILSAVF